MGYKTKGLTFNTLRGGNVARIEFFARHQGKFSKTGEWTPAQWLQAVVGELGEYANLRKKVERGDLTLDQARPELAKELADVVVYLDILASKVGVDLGQAVMDKFNEVSERVECPVYLDAENWYLLQNDK